MNVFQKLRVLELGRVYSGPLCGMVLSDLGAEVIKIERPLTGDESRSFGKEGAKSNSYFNSLNRNKKSIDLDLKNEEDRKLMRQLIATSDVFIHNWIQSSLDKLGFSYDEVKAINKKIVYCTISGYGQTSPFKDLPSQDIIAQSLSGLMSLTGEKERMPLKTGIPIVDYATGLYAAFSIMSALYMRQITGEGQWVHTSLLETAVAMSSFEASHYLETKQVPLRSGNRHPSICPYNVYPVSDGYVTIAVANDAMWKRFTRALELMEYASDERFSTNQKRLINQDELEKIIESRITHLPVKDLVNKLRHFHVSCAEVHDVKHAFASPEVAALNMMHYFDESEKSATVRKPFTLEGCPETDIQRPPHLGEHKDLIKVSLK